MAIILAVETATKSCSVALFENDRLISKKEQHGNYSHAENLAVFTDQLLKENKLNARKISAIAVSKGPGSYTGLRIGVSFVKGLCYSLKIPLISIDTLKSIAFGVALRAKKSDALICPMLDARRMEVYSAVFNSDLKSIQAISAEIIDETSYATLLNKNKIIFLGDGADKCKEIIDHSNAEFIEGVFPSASTMGVLAYNKFKNQNFENVAYFEPYYLKEFIALKGKKML